MGHVIGGKFSYYNSILFNSLCHQRKILIINQEEGYIISSLKMNSTIYDYTGSAYTTAVVIYI